MFRKNHVVKGAALSALLIFLTGVSILRGADRKVSSGQEKTQVPKTHEVTPEKKEKSGEKTPLEKQKTKKTSTEEYDFDHDAPWYPCPETDFPENAIVVTAFDHVYHYFGKKNRREIRRTVQFPEEAKWKQVGAYLLLECPQSGLCDHWDRTGSVQLVLNPESEKEKWEYLELIRHVTPYRAGMCQYVDLTPVAHLLKGRQTLSSWIDTWVGPDHKNGEGWRLTLKFVFYPGPDRGADQVVNIWGRRPITLGFTDAEKNVDSQIDPVRVPIPNDVTRVEAHLITTGHAFGNTLNCAEFCQLRQDLHVNGHACSVNPWRNDCEFNPVVPQYGTWDFDRNGWCPGTTVVGHKIDITEEIKAGKINTIDFDIRLVNGSEYKNLNPGKFAPFEWVSLKLYLFR